MVNIELPELVQRVVVSLHRGVVWFQGKRHVFFYSERRVYDGYPDRKHAKLDPWVPKRGNPNFVWLSHYVRISTDSNSAHFVLTWLVFALVGIERKERRPDAAMHATACDLYSRLSG